MRKPKKSSIKFEMVNVVLERPPSTVPSMSPETLAFMRESEAREWIARYKKKIGEAGAANGRSWWEQTKKDIARVRGAEALHSLLSLMEQERAKSRAVLPGAGIVSEPKQGQALGNATQSEDRGEGDRLLDDKKLSEAQSAIGRGGVDDHF